MDMSGYELIYDKEFCGPNNKYVAYCCVCNGEPIYVGITKKNIRTRVRYHFRETRIGNNRKFYNKLRKSKDECKWYLVGANEDYEKLKELETELIQQFNTFYLDNPNGCNLTLGGDSGGYVPNPEQVKKFVNRMKKYWAKPENKKAHAERTAAYYKENKASVVAYLKSGWTAAARKRGSSAQKNRFKRRSELVKNSKRGLEHWKNITEEQRLNHSIQTSIATKKAFDRKRKVNCINRSFISSERMFGI